MRDNQIAPVLERVGARNLKVFVPLDSGDRAADQSGDIINKRQNRIAQLFVVIQFDALSARICADFDRYNYFALISLDRPPAQQQQL